MDRCLGDGFKIIADDEVVLASKGSSRLPIPLRRIKIRRENGGAMTLRTNDLTSTAAEIATLYKGRWQIDIDQSWLLLRLFV